MKLGRVVLDGSKVKANASKHKAMSYGRMQEEEKRLQEEVQRLLEQAKAADEEEDARYGRDRRGEELPAELARRETRIQRIREVKQALEERARAEAENKRAVAGRSHAEAEDAIQLHRPGIAHHEGAGGLRAGLQNSDRGRAELAADRGPDSHAGGE